MALGDGTTWDESTPTDASWAYQIDDYNRDVRKGVRSRLALEHEWPSSQTGTSEGGRHKFVTLQIQTTTPTLYATQPGVLFTQYGTIGTATATGAFLYFANSTGATCLVAGTSVGPAPYNTAGGLVTVDATNVIKGNIVHTTLTSTAASSSTQTAAVASYFINAFNASDTTQCIAYLGANMTAVTSECARSVAVVDNGVAFFVPKGVCWRVTGASNFKILTIGD